MFSAPISPELFEVVSRVIGEQKVNRTVFMTRALALLLEELCEPVPAVTRRELATPYVDGRRLRWNPGATQGD